MRLRVPLVSCCVVASVVLAAIVCRAEPTPRTWTIDGRTREALVCEPAPADGGATRHPVVFVFHGHGGTMRHAARTMALHTLWRDALVIYPQGLPTPGRITDPEGNRPGWQREAGDQGDRDLKFVDAMLAAMRADRNVDDRRIFATGHSNGGAFTYLLWAERGETFAAFAPSAALYARGAGKFMPRPVLHLGSPTDPLVKWTWQSRMIDHVITVNNCGPRQPDAPGYILYAPRSGFGAPVAVFIHDGGHGYPPIAPKLIVEFLQVHGLP